MDREEIDMLLDGAERWFKANEPLEDRVASFRNGPHEAPHAWARMAELGWLALTLPEADGGFGASHVAVFELLKRAGREARPEPLGLHSMLVPWRRAASDVADRGQIAAALAEGRLRLALADIALGDGAVHLAGSVDGNPTLNGDAGTVLGAEHATHLLLPVPAADGNPGIAEVALDAPGIRREPARLIDGRATAFFRFDHTPARWFGGPAAQQVRDRAAAAFVADSAGVLEAAFDLTLDYLKQRLQFGKPLSAQQAVQHKMAEVFCDLQQSIALSGRVAAEMDGAPSGPWPSLPAAKAFIGRRALRAAGQLIQVSGGIAVTEDYKLTHFYRRLHVAAALFGSAEEQLERIDVRASLLAA